MQDSSGGRQSVWEDRATPRLRQRLLPRSECGRLGLRAGGGEGIPVSRWVSLAFTLHPVLSLLFFFFSSRLSHCLLLSPRLVAGKGKVGWKRGGVGMRLHILLLASETCSVMCAESGIGKFGSSTFGESGWGEREVRAFGKDLRV